MRKENGLLFKRNSDGKSFWICVAFSIGNTIAAKYFPNDRDKR